MYKKSIINDEIIWIRFPMRRICFDQDVEWIVRQRGAILLC
jgi:hypothetical protein